MHMVHWKGSGEGPNADRLERLYLPTHDARWSGRPGWGALGCVEGEGQKVMGGVAGVFAE